MNRFDGNLARQLDLLPAPEPTAPAPVRHPSVPARPNFKLLKQVLRPVIDRIDHQMLNDLEPFTVINPSAENLAKYLYDQTNSNLVDVTHGRVRVKDCTIWETDTTTATYYE